MRPLFRLLGRSDLIVDGAAVPVRITRKLWYVIGLIGTSPNCEVEREELTEAAWPLSDDKSRNVLLHMWRKSILDATADVITGTPVRITEHHVSIDTTCVCVDFQECYRLAKIVLHSDDAELVLDAGTAYDALAEDKILLPSFPTAFMEIRKDFDTQRKAVLRRTWQAENHLNGEPYRVSSVFATRLRTLGDTNEVGSPAIPFKSHQSNPPDRTKSYPSASQVTAGAIIAIIITAPIVVGRLNTPSKSDLPVGLSKSVNKPISDLSRRVLFQLTKPDIERSLATSITTSQDGQIFVAGTAIKRDGSRQLITAKLAKSGKVRWLSTLDCEAGIFYTPKQVLHTPAGRTYVASRVRAEVGNARRLAQGSYFAITTFTQDGVRVAERIHPGEIDDNLPYSIQLITDLKGGAVAIANAKTESPVLVLHAPDGSAEANSISFPSSFRITDALTDGKLTQFLLGYVTTRTSKGMRHDWSVQAVNKVGKVVWTRTIKGATGPTSTNVRGVINHQGNLVIYGALPTPEQQTAGRVVASIVTLSQTTGAVIQQDHYDSENQNLDFALCTLPAAMATVIGVTQRSPNGSERITMHRFGNAETDTALTLTVRLPGHQRVGSFVSLTFDTNGALNALLRPIPQKSSNVALTYIRKYYGREISTGSLSSSIPFAYTKTAGGYVAGHYNNTFCVYNFSQLP